MTDEKKRRIEELRRELEEEGKRRQVFSRFPINPPRSRKMMELLKLLLEEHEENEEK